MCIKVEKQRWMLRVIAEYKQHLAFATMTEKEEKKNAHKNLSSSKYKSI